MLPLNGPSFVQKVMQITAKSYRSALVHELFFFFNRVSQTVAKVRATCSFHQKSTCARSPWKPVGLRCYWGSCCNTDEDLTGSSPQLPRSPVADGTECWGRRRRMALNFWRFPKNCLPKYQLTADLREHAGSRLSTFMSDMHQFYYSYYYF